MDIIAERFANSLALMCCAWLLSGIIGFVLGCVMGMNKDRWIDKAIKKLCYLISSVPTFWLGLVLVLAVRALVKYIQILNKRKGGAKQ